jgi:hypothetical protein
MATTSCVGHSEHSSMKPTMSLNRIVT